MTASKARNGKQPERQHGGHTFVIRGARSKVYRTVTKARGEPFPKPQPSSDAAGPSPSDSALFWADVFSAGRDKAVEDLLDKGAPVYTYRDGKVVDVSDELRQHRNAQRR